MNGACMNNEVLLLLVLEVLKATRKRKRLTQKQLAQRLGVQIITLFLRGNSGA